MTKYVSASDSLRPGQLDRLVAKIKDHNPKTAELTKLPKTPKLPAAHTTVPPTGELSAPYVLVGEAPGKIEVRERKPFVGPAGQELDRGLNTAFISKPLCYLTNTIKALDKPIGSYVQLYKNKRLLKVPIISELGQAYIDFLQWELSQTSTPVFGAIGAISMYVLTGKIGITKWRGSILDCTLVPGRKVIPILHPATVVAPKYNYLNRRLIAFDLKRLNEVASKLHVPTERELIIEPTFLQVMEFLELCLTKGLRGHRIGYDIEVYMKRVHKQISCISFSIGLKSICIPFVDTKGDYFLLNQEATIWKKIAEILEHPDIRIVAQNITFDSHFLLRTYGICVTNLDDTMVAQNIILPDYPKGLHFITSIFTDHPYYKDDGKNFIGTSSENYRHYWIYNATDSIICTEAIPKQMGEIQRLKDTTIYHNQIKIIGPLVYMMERGIRMDVVAMTALRSDYEQRIDEAQLELNKLVGEPLNAKSSKQLQAYFEGKKNIKPYINKGKVSYDDTTMKRLKRRGFKEAEYIQQIRRYTKLRSTYLDLTKIDVDGRWRCSFNPAGTRFSRLSSSTNIWGSGGNTQNIPHDLQEYMLPDEGYVYYAFDLEQAENRIVAYVGEIIEMIECFEKDIDVHARTARMIMSVYYGGRIPKDINVKSPSPFGDKTHEWRHFGKKSNHCLLGDTDVLTETGWAPINIASYEGKKIACFSQEDGKITFETPSEWFSSEYSGTLVNFKGKYLSQRVTPEHRIPFKSRYDASFGKLRWGKAESIKLTSGREWPLAGKRIDGTLEMPELAIRLMIAFQADGGWDYNGPLWHLKNKTKIERIQMILNMLGVDYTKREQNEYKLFYIKTSNIERAFLASLFSKDKNWPIEIINFSQSCIEIFCDEIVRWDGDGSCYWTSIKKNAEIVQTMFHLGGFKSSIGWACKETGTYRVPKLKKPETRLDIITRTFEEVKDEKIYCPTVSTGAFLIKHNGIISVTGNSLNYDMGYKAFALVNELNERDGKMIYDSYHKLYPGVQQNFHAHVRKNLRTTRSLTNLMGRTTLFMGALRGPQSDITFKEAYSCIPQGTVGDIINKRGLNYIYYNQELFKPIELLRQVHDEIGFQIPLSASWETHAKMLRLVKRSLEEPLKTHNGRSFVIPAGLTIGKSLNKSSKTSCKDIKDITAENLKNIWGELNEKRNV